MQLVYAAKFARTSPDEIVVSFRDIPECLTSGVDDRDAFAEATDALEEAIAGRIDDGEYIPVPTAPRPMNARSQFHVAWLPRLPSH